MAWAKLDDRFYEHPTIVNLTDKAHRLYTSSLSRAADRLNDGHLDDIDLRILLVCTGAKQRHIDELVASGKWHQNGKGYVINDFGDYNPTAETVKERRRQNAERQNRHRGRNA